jgi:hypothetical protein
MFSLGFWVGATRLTKQPLDRPRSMQVELQGEVVRIGDFSSSDRFNEKQYNFIMKRFPFSLALYYESKASI